MIDELSVGGERHVWLRYKKDASTGQEFFGCQICMAHLGRQPHHRQSFARFEMLLSANLKREAIKTHIGKGHKQSANNDHQEAVRQWRIFNGVHPSGRKPKTDKEQPQGQEGRDLPLVFQRQKMRNEIEASERMLNRRMDEQTSRQMDKQTHRRTDERADGRTDECMDELN